MANQLRGFVLHLALNVKGFRLALLSMALSAVFAAVMTMPIGGGGGVG